MKELCVNPYFKNFFIPLFAILFTGIVKAVSKRDKHKKFKSDDLSFGFELIAASLLTIFLYSSRIATELSRNPKAVRSEVYLSRLQSLPLLLLFFALGLWGLSTVVRFWGWDDSDPDNPKMTRYVGIILPDIIGVAVLFFTVNFAD